MNVLSAKYFIASLKNDYEDKVIVVNDDYQRKFVWPKKFQRALILSILKDFPIGTLIIRIGLKTGRD